MEYDLVGRAILRRPVNQVDVVLQGRGVMGKNIK